MRQLSIVVVLLSFTIGLTGCTKPEETGAASSGAGAEQLKPTSPDDKIAKDVKSKFAKDPELAKEKIDVTVKDGRVLLAGTVSSDAIRMKAEDTARSLDDVFGVDAEKLVVGNP